MTTAVTNAVVSTAVGRFFDPDEFLGLRQVREAAFGMHKAVQDSLGLHRAAQAAVAPLAAKREAARWVTAPMDRWVQAAIPRITVPEFVVPTFDLPELFVPRFTDWWPAGSLMTSMMRPVDAFHIALPDVSRLLLDNILDGTRWLGRPDDEPWLDGLWTEVRAASAAGRSTGRCSAPARPCATATSTS